jgi:hypothetical protein
MASTADLISDVGGFSERGRELWREHGRNRRPAVPEVGDAHEASLAFRFAALEGDFGFFRSLTP